MKKMKMMRERQTHMVHKRRVLRSWIECNTNTNEKDEDCFPCTGVCCMEKSSFFEYSDMK